MHSKSKIAYAVAVGYVLAVSTSSVLPDFVSIATPVFFGMGMYMLQKKMISKKTEITATSSGVSYASEVTKIHEELRYKAYFTHSDIMKRTEEIGEHLVKVLPYVEEMGSTKLQFQIKNGLKELVLIVEKLNTIEDEVMKKKTLQVILKQGFHPYLEQLRNINQNRNNHNMQNILTHLEQPNH